MHNMQHSHLFLNSANLNNQIISICLILTDKSSYATLVCIGLSLHYN